MTMDQILLFAILGSAMALFIWGRWRYDIVAFSALMLATLLRLVPGEEAFLGFGHPAVVTVAAVLVISRALQNSGIVGWLARQMTEAEISPSLQIGAIAALVAALSGFMNNVGALALLMPVVLQIARKSNREPRELLMPLAFGSLLGGCLGSGTEFPDIEGWSRDGEVRVWTSENLWEYIDGAAELFIDYEVVTCRVADLSAGGVTVTVDLYDMGTPLNAFGIFDLESSGRGGPIAGAKVKLYEVRPRDDDDTDAEAISQSVTDRAGMARLATGSSRFVRVVVSHGNDEAGILEGLHDT